MHSKSFKNSDKNAPLDVLAKWFHKRTLLFVSCVEMTNPMLKIAPIEIFFIILNYHTKMSVFHENWHAHP
jgi:hypothetical protein